MTSHAAVYQSPRNFHDSLSHIVTFNISPVLDMDFGVACLHSRCVESTPSCFLRVCLFLTVIETFWSDHTRNRSDVVMFFSYVLSFVSVTFSAAMGDCSGIIGLTA